MSALTLFPQNQTLLDEKEILGRCKPKDLLTVCPPYQTSALDAAASYKIAGDTYGKGFRITESYGHAYFNLKGQYETLSFDVGHVDGKSMYTGYYYFYLDGTLVHTLTLKPGMLIEHVEIPLDGAEQMVIKGGDGSHCFALVNVAVTTKK